MPLGTTFEFNVILYSFMKGLKDELIKIILNMQVYDRKYVDLTISEVNCSHTPNITNRFENGEYPIRVHLIKGPRFKPYSN